MERAPIGSLALLLLLVVQGVESIGCFVCVSKNGSNLACEDPFDSQLLVGAKAGAKNYHPQCWAYKKGREGLFPADHCIKINGIAESNGEKMFIRTCALDSGSLTADTEIVRISHCGHFKFENDSYAGCVQSCDTDGCNAVSDAVLFSSLAILMLFIALC